MERRRGLVVGITADRRSDEQARLFEKLGIRAVVGPALATVMTTEEGALRAVTEDLVGRPPDDLVADTGVGIRSWMDAAAAWGLADRLKEALGATRILARGPKAVGALRSAGLAVAWRAPSEQLAELIDHLAGEDLSGRRVVLQLHGEDDPASAQRLRDAGGEVVTLPVYRWSVPEDQAPALRLITLACEGELDAVTFTAAPAVHNLMALAEQAGLAEDLRRALNAGVVGCVGPVCAEAARQEGLTAPIFPEHYRLGSLVHLVADELRVSA
jgi:uroporphyrinogen-III synthase